ncbi:hypothetical protein KFK09_009449 [Dendrobium nobile]|uniref:Protein kinase G11A n=1 Tax=Dendrobium nobile TaxID=94219 RepID=A0A8T3BJW4_DENNO|nr:hypothetical protein KFK09_009449 [Dendrobium nobile]
MDSISTKKRSSKIKKKAQFTLTELEIGNPVLISGPGLKKSGPSFEHVTSIEEISGNMNLKEATNSIIDIATNSSKNLFEDLISSSNSLFSTKTLCPSPHPSNKPNINLEILSGKGLSIKKKLHIFTKGGSNLANRSRSSNSLVSCSCSKFKPAKTYETINGKESDAKKIIDSANRDEVNSIKDLSSSLSLNPSPCSSVSSKISSSTITTISCLKPIDKRTSDGGNSTSQRSCSSSQRDNLDSYSSMTSQVKRHTGHDSRWEAIHLASSRDLPLGLGNFKLLKRLGYGDIGSVYLVHLKDTDAYFAMKVMDRASIISRNKMIRAQTEREILSLLDHPFLPTLYSHFETDKFYCLVMEYCSGGNLHSLRQKQPYKCFTEQAVRFYASEVLLALEYLHMLGIVYRDLKPENVLVREEGHIMLSDFDLSFQCSVNPTLVKSSSLHGESSRDLECLLDADGSIQGCIQPTVLFPRIIPKRNRKSKSDFGPGAGLLPELLAEPTNARSMSFVGTHEYLAPEIIRGEGHGSAVDWWTFGIFIYEMIYGTTPFKGSGNRDTLLNVIGQPLRFPEEPIISRSARDLIRSLLVKDPQRRIACRRGATEIKQHQFFDGVNWALVRSLQPPHVPETVDFGQFASKDITGRKKKATAENPPTSQVDFEYF